MNEPTGGGAWGSAAACAGLGPTLFYDPSPRSVRAAKAVCGRCDVIAECTEHASATGELFGIWGGQTETERANERGNPARGPLPFISDADLIAALESADPLVLAIEVLRHRFGLKPDVAYKCLVRGLRLGLIERRGGTCIRLASSEPTDVSSRAGCAVARLRRGAVWAASSWLSSPLAALRGGLPSVG